MKKLLLLVFLSILSFTGVKGQLTFTLESGLVFTQYNDVQAPNTNQANSSRFSLKDDFSEVATPVYLRAELQYLIAQKHTVELTAAPLKVESRNLELFVISFENNIFSTGGTDATYQFNTYRLTYRYRFIDRKKFILDAGASLLVRDAAITLAQGPVSVSNTDLGFVPLISLNTRYKLSEDFEVILKGDALAGPVGRAEDFFLGLRYRPIKSIGVRAGYRLIEGGADVDQVYNFAFFHFAAAGLQVTF